MEKQNIFKRRKLFPIILINTKLGMLRVVNEKSTTLFKISNHETKSCLDSQFEDEDGWTAEKEVEMAVGSGFHRIHESDDERWAIWDAGKE